MENVLHELLSLITNNPNTVDTKSKKYLTFLQKLLVCEKTTRIYIHDFFFFCFVRQKKRKTPYIFLLEVSTLFQTCMMGGVSLVVPSSSSSSNFFGNIFFGEIFN